MTHRAARLQASGARSASGRAATARTELAVEFAELFDIELLGLFIEDSGLRRLAGIPDARESVRRRGLEPIEPAHMDTRI